MTRTTPHAKRIKELEEIVSLQRLKVIPPRYRNILNKTYLE